MGGTISQEELESWIADQEHKARAALEARIRQLEDSNAKLAAEVDRQRLVMDATTMVLEYQYRVSDSFAWRAVDDLRLALLAYQASKPKMKGTGGVGRRLTT